MSLNPLDIYIFGAGASHAAIAEMPLMNDFFKCIASHANYKRKDLWQCLAILDYLRLFNKPNINCENLSAQIFAHSMNQTKQNRITEKYLKESVKRFTENSAEENLESIFEKAHDAPSVYGKSPRHRMLAAINELFRSLSLKYSSRENVYEKFVKYALSNSRNSVFVSFNYDLLLDQALFKTTSWDPRTGYGFRFDSSTQVEGLTKRSKDFLEINGLLLLKPHGSLSWRIEKNLGFDSPKSYLTMNRYECPDYERYYMPTHANKNWKKFQILVVPPISSKLISHPALYETRKKLKQLLRQATTITTIGWSLPETDGDMRGLIHGIFDGFDARNEQLKTLKIIDYKAQKAQLNRIQTVFMAKENVVFNEGFSAYTDEYTGG